MNAETIARALGGRKAGGAGRRDAQPTMIPRRVFRSATRVPARCWCAAMRAATRNA